MTKQVSKIIFKAKFYISTKELKLKSHMKPRVAEVKERERSDP